MRETQFSDEKAPNKGSFQQVKLEHFSFRKVKKCSLQLNY